MDRETKKELIYVINHDQRLTGRLLLNEDGDVVWSENTEYIIPEEDLSTLAAAIIAEWKAIAKLNEARLRRAEAMMEAMDAPFWRRLDDFLKSA